MSDKEPFRGEVIAAKRIWRIRRQACCVFLIAILFAGGAAGLDIQLPPEKGVFKQDVGAEIANGQCLTCHSVEYVETQPPMPAAFWKSSVQKMQQKYGAQIPDAQVEEVVQYLTRNYGITKGETNRATAIEPRKTSGKPTDGSQLATKYGCLGCHNQTIRVVGPAYRDIAEKYKSNPDRDKLIAEQIHKGGSGKWGPVIMPPFPQVNAEETRALTDWIMGSKQ